MYVTYANGSTGSIRRPTTTTSTTTTTTTTLEEQNPDRTICSVSAASTTTTMTTATATTNGGDTMTSTSSSTSTTMPSSPETTSFTGGIGADPSSSCSSTAMMMFTTTTSPIVRDSDMSSPSPRLVSSATATHTSGCPSPPTPPLAQHPNHDEDRFTTCTGLSALIQAATSQLEYLAEIASCEYIIQTDDLDHGHNNDLTLTTSQIQSSRRTSLVTTPSITSTPTQTTTMTRAPHVTTWKEDSFPEQLMKLLLSIRSNEESTDASTTAHSPSNPHDMISFLPNGKYFVVRQSSLTQYLRNTDHALFDRPSSHSESSSKEDEHVISEMPTEDGNFFLEDPDHRTTTNETTTPMDIPSHGSHHHHDHHRTKTRIRTFSEFVHTLLYRYRFTWIDHRYLSSQAVRWSTPNEDDHDTSTATSHTPPPPPLPNSSIIYPEIMVFRHEHFVEQQASLCQQIPYCGESSQALQSPSRLGPSTDPTSITQTLQHHNKKSTYKRHDQNHSKVVHNHHAVVAAQLQQPSTSTSATSTSAPPESNDPTTSSTSTSTKSSAITAYDVTSSHPSSPIVQDGSSTTITKRRLSPGFLRQQEQKNGLTTSKQKVKMDLSNVTGIVVPVTDESTRTTAFGVDEDSYLCDTTMTTASTTTVATTNMTDGTEGSSIAVPMTTATTTTTTTLTDHDARKLSSGCESDMTNTTSHTGSASVSNDHPDHAHHTTAQHVNFLPLVIPNPIGASEDTTANTIRNIAISIANEKLQLPIARTSTLTTRNGNTNSNKTSNDSEESTNSISQPDRDKETPTLSSSLSELVELGITTSTKEIVIAAIECLLSQPSHSHEVYQQNLQELSKSSLPNLIPICQHIFENHSYLYNNTNIVTTKQDANSASNVENDGMESRPFIVQASVALSSVMTNTVTPEIIVNSGGVGSQASSSSLVRVITTGSDGDHTINQFDGSSRTPAGAMNPRNLNDDSTTVTVSTESTPQAEIVLPTRVTTRRASAKGNAGTAD